MLNKGFVKLFSVLLTLVCLFYISFSVVTKHYATKAEEASNGDRVKMSMYLDSLSTKKVWLGYTLKECREMEINLGLDLKGGMSVILELNVQDVLRSFSGYNQDENFNKALAAASARQLKEQGNYIDFFAQEYKKLDPNARLAGLFSFEFKDKISSTSSDADVIKVLKAEMESAISNSFNVLRTRIDRFGVVSPNIQRMEQDGRISIELPGVKEPERVRKLLQGSANLEFWTTYNFEEVYQNLIQANNVIRDLKKSDKGGVAKIDSTALAANAPKAAANDSTKTASATNDTLLAKIKSKNQTEKASTNDVAAMRKEYPLLSILITQNQYPKGPAVGVAHYRDTAQINSYLHLKSVRDVLPHNVQFRWSVKSVDEAGQFYQLVAIKVINRNGKAPLSGDVVTDARDDFEKNSSSASVSMSMNAEGAKEWAKLTKENVGKCIAIVLDNYVYSFPRVNDEITGGNSSITGNFTPEEAKDLANVLKSGKMAASVRIVQEDVVGPSLGKEAIQNGMISFAFALLLIMFYMVAVYGVVPGLVANAALLVNMFFTMGILASFQSVLTLPGIAGLVLTMGIAVDANVLIYERTKEELRSGKSMRKAVEEGYKHAFSAIFDSNLTSIITAIILFQLGTGPIKGFAFTSGVGILCSFFTAVFLTRITYEGAFAKGWKAFNDLTFTTSISKNLLVHPTIKWVSMRKKGYVASAILIAVIITSFFTFGLKAGIDFTGGRNYIVRFDQQVNPAKITEDLKPFFGESAVSAITIGDKNQIRVTTNYRIEENDPSIDGEISQKMFEGLKPLLPANTTIDKFTTENIVSSQKVGPAVAKDITRGAMLAVFFAIIAMGIYILFRFRDLAFSAGTIASLLHDTIIIIGVYSLAYKFVPFSMDVDLSFIAAILTVIGYSVNDTVIIFDRIREIMTNYPKRNLKRLMDEALNSTLSRTMSTSFCTAIVLLCIFLLGGDTIRSFTFAMFIGVIIGTYSTFFIAMPVAYEMMKRKHKLQETDEEEEA